MDIYTVAMFLAKLQVTVTRDKQYSAGFGPIVKYFTDRIYPICTESYKVAKASITALFVMGHCHEKF